MARLHEYQGKALLAEQGIAIPRGRSTSKAGEAAEIAAEIGGPVVVKIQAWTTGRAAIGGVRFAETPGQAAAHAETLLLMRVGNFPVQRVLVEERLDIAREFFVSLFISDAGRSPVILFAASGGSGIEQRASEVRRLSCDVAEGPGRGELAEAVAAAGVDAAQHDMLIDAVRSVFDLAKRCDARSIEINPLVITGDGRVVAADCRMTIDDYAVFRHPELGIDIARELDHPPTALERAAYEIEQADHRGTFYFAQLNTEAEEKALGTGHQALERKQQSTWKGGPSASAGSLRAPEEGIRDQASGNGEGIRDRASGIGKEGTS
ncbi:MAG: acetate--CoA ligase family protein, partial [Planctomycetes bacterium]|nr:acetate--CoA ligase family protein [Planctomycetota bacterium]